MRKKSTLPVRVDIDAGYEVLSCTLTMEDWHCIQAGEVFCCEVPYWYEGKKFTSDWTFNGSRAGTLYVGYDDGGVHLDGRLSEARVFLNEEPVKGWQTKAKEPAAAADPPLAQPKFDWEEHLQELDARLRAAGRTVTVIEPSDTNVFTATFPQGRRPNSTERG